MYDMLLLSVKKKTHLTSYIKLIIPCGGASVQAMVPPALVQNDERM
jgi:hypothetical protein